MASSQLQLERKVKSCSDGRWSSNTLDFNLLLHIDTNHESRVLVLYTGGTIGMVRNEDNVLSPKPNAFESQVRKTCTMNDQAYSNSRFKHIQRLHEDNGQMIEADLPLVLPYVPEHRRVLYTIYEHHPLLDSSNMTMDDWIQIAMAIKDNYELFDGFVILHGTDTLAYTASALSFMLEHLGKPVIVTGSQIPSFETRSDGRDNFVGALILAGNYNIPEVTVYFRHRLLRGNRTVKMSAGNLDAFQSPNMAPLALTEIRIDVDYKAIHRPTSMSKLRAHVSLNRNVVLLRLFPSIQSDTLAHFLKPPIQGVVLQCYGTGNIPSNRQDILCMLKEATERGVLILCVTQCTHGAVSSLYATGKALLDCGVISGCDITPEAAVAKLSYILSKDEWDLETKRKKAQTNLVGEMTIRSFKENQDEAKDLVGAVAEALMLRTSEEKEDLAKMLYPSLLSSAACSGITSKVQSLLFYGLDPNTADYDSRTPLHVAASEGNLEVVELLIKHGASLHVKDRMGDTPLMSAVEAEQSSVVKLMVQGGAHLLLTGMELGERMCSLARRGQVKKMTCYVLAGANLNATNLVKQTALHAAVEAGQKEVVQFLIKENVNMKKRDVFGRTPREVAMILRRTEMAKLLE